MKYKVVTSDLKSLGLRRNPNILQYRVGEWMALPVEHVEPGPSDWGGIWCAATLGRARGLQRYVNDKYNMDARIFHVEIGHILYHNSYRVKTDRVRLMEEIYGVRRLDSV